MKKTLIAFATAAGLTVILGNASADPGGYSPPHPGTGGGGGSPFQIGGPDTLLGAGAPTGRAPDRYGWNPILKRGFRLGGPNVPPGGNPLNNPGNWAAGGYGQGGPAYNPGGFPPQGGGYGPQGCGAPGCGPQGPQQQGTLVFPNHTFVRSPRDYFMMDMNK